MSLAADAREFRMEKTKQAENAAQLAALFLTGGIDLDDALTETGQGKARLEARILRLLERERLRGQRRHLSYDLNRHIALKKALDRLRHQTR